MHAERAAARGDVTEQLVKPRVGGHERGVLVDDDHEARQDAGVIADLPRPGLGEHPLAVPDLGAQALDGAERLGVIEVGQHPRHVRQTGECVEGAAALEVDEQERDLPRAAAAAHPRDPGGQQLALARPGDPDDDGMRAVGDEIDEDGLSPGRSDPRRQRFRRRRRGGQIRERDRPVDPLPQLRGPRREFVGDGERLTGGHRLDADLARGAAVLQPRPPRRRQRQHRRAPRWRGRAVRDAHDRDVDVVRHAAPVRCHEQGRAAGGLALRQPRRQRVGIPLPGTHDAHTARRMRETHLQRERPRDRRGGGCGSADRDARLQRHRDGRVLEQPRASPHGAGGVVVRLAVHAHRAPGGAATDDDDLLPPRNLTPDLAGRGAVSRDVGRPRPGPATFVGVTLGERRVDRGQFRRRLTACPAGDASRSAQPVGEPGDRQHRAEGGEPERIHRTCQPPEDHGADDGHDGGEERNRRSRWRRRGCGQPDRVAGIRVEVLVMHARQSSASPRRAAPERADRWRTRVSRPLGRRRCGARSAR